MFNTLNNSITPTLSQIQQQVAQLLGQSGGTGNLATKQDVDNAKAQLSEMLMIAMGIMPCPADKAPPGFCTNFGSLSKLGADTTQILIGMNNANVKLDTVATQASVDGILIGLNNALSVKLGPLEDKIEELQVALDNMASQALDVRAVQIDSGNPKQLRWLVKTTRDGVIVNASLTRFATIRATGAGVLANVMSNANVVSLGTGLHDVTLTLVKDVTDGAAYLFEASLTAGGSTIQGSALLVTEKKGASPF